MEGTAHTPTMTGKQTTIVTFPIRAIKEVFALTPNVPRLVLEGSVGVWSIRGVAGEIIG